MTDTFNEYRPLLFSIAYRMLGTIMDAEDMLQEAYLRWSRTPHGDIENHRAWLSAVVTRLCIDQLRSARVKREEYIGPWLPEPLLMDTPKDPVVLAESLSTGFMVLMEHLNPVERAVYLLREVFDYEYAEIAAIVEKNEANCRQLASRAKKHLHEQPTTLDPDPTEGQRLTEQFMQTVIDGDMNTLLNLLADDIVIYSDGGGKATAARTPVTGAKKAVRFFIGLTKQAPEGLLIHKTLVNGLPGLVLTIGDSPLAVMAFFFDQGQLQNVYTVLNPDKLGNIHTTY